MKNTFYKATTTSHGLQKGKIYFAEGDGRIVVGTEERVSAAMLVWKKVLEPIPVFDGILKENWEYPLKKSNFLMEVADGLDYREMEVTIIKAQELKKRKAFVCLVMLPDEKDVVQLDIPNVFRR